MDQGPTYVSKLTKAVIIAMSNLVPKEGSEQGDVSDESKDGDDAVEGDEGVVGAVRHPAGKALWFGDLETFTDGTW